MVLATISQSDSNFMKKIIFITVGILSLIIILGVWGYLFTYGTPKSATEVFTQFGFGGGSGEPMLTRDDTTIDVGEQILGGGREALRQLTTRPVAGAVQGTTNEITYVEQGTGHIYSINLIDGKETLKSGTTIPQASEALFSKDASYAAITTYSNFGNQTFVYPLTVGQGSSTSGFELPFGSENIAFGKATGTLMYTEKIPSGSIGYSYNIKKGVSTEVFRIALRDVRVLWGEPIYVYSLPTATQSGHLYKLSGNNLLYTTTGGNGLVGFRYDDGVVVTRMIDGVRAMTARTHMGEEGTQVLPFIPEKCTVIPSQENIVYCAVPTNMSNSVFPDDWYKGVVSYSDILWSMNIENGEATGLSDFLTESGREIDVVQIGTDATGEKIWFVNKNDNSLWLFENEVQ